MEDCGLDLIWVSDTFGLATPDFRPPTFQVLLTRALTVPNQHKDVQETKTGIELSLVLTSTTSLETVEPSLSESIGQTRITASHHRRSNQSDTD